MGMLPFTVHLKRYRNMILLSVFFFYLGCGITLNFLRVECTDAVTSVTPQTDVSISFNRVEYAVLVLTSPENEVKRDAIRTTWARLIGNIIMENGKKVYKWNHTWTGKHLQKDFIKICFVVGTQGLNADKLSKLNNENMRSNDLLLMDNFEDAYKNLAAKTLNALKWFIHNFKNLKYLIKCDDDSFLRVDLIIKELEAYAPEMNAPEINKYVSYKADCSSCKGLYWGYFDGRARVYLNGKWQERDWFMCDNYLPYALGGGYVISRTIVDYITKNADFLKLYNSEDVSMGVWTAALNGINRVHDIRFDTEWKSRGCNNNMLVRHKQTPNNMFEMFKTLVYSNGEILCKTPINKRNSYLYKWNVLPSVCCSR